MVKIFMLDQLKKLLIISLNDILKLKKYIADKYLNLSSKERAEILSNSVHRVIDSHLNGIDEEYKGAVRHQVLNSTIAKQKYDISKYDVLKSIFTLELNPSDQISLATQWLNEITDIAYEPSELFEFIVSYSDELIISNHTLHSTIEEPISKGNDNEHSDLKSWFIHNLLRPQLATYFIIFSLITFLISSVIIYAKRPIEAKERIYSIERAGYSYSNIFLNNSAPLIKTVTISIQDEITRLELHYQQQVKLPNKYRFNYFDYFSLRKYILIDRNGYVGNPFYLNRIISLSKLNDIDPLLLLAIIGQEQAFVPISHPDKELIINNPYNVYFSWKSYNTNITDSTQIAINTIKNSFNRHNSQNADMDEIEWLNLTYAEDQKWHAGVKLIYLKLESICR